MRNLFINWYVDDDSGRQEELETCLLTNLESGLIDRIFLVSEDGNPVPKNDMVVLIDIGRRPTFSDFFALVNLYSTDENDINIIANTDIYFDDSIKVLDRIPMQNKCFALSRWDVLENNESRLHDHLDSQDAWIFKGKIKAYIDGDFHLGKRGCDNRILREIRVAGYNVANPSKIIKAHHLHITDKRNYSIHGKDDLVPGPYDFAIPGGVDAIFPPKKILHIALNDFGRPQMALREALMSMGEYHEFDWIKEQLNVGIPDLKEKIVETARTISPDFTFIQTQNGEIVDPFMVRKMPGVIMNWTGDVRYPIPSWYYDLGKSIDITCFSNMHDVRELQKENIPAGFLQIGVDTELFANHGEKRDVQDVVFMGNNYPDKFPLSRFRKNMVRFLQTHIGHIFCLYGVGWDPAEFHAMDLVGKEPEEAAVYRSCKIAINCSHFNYKRYSSDRLFRIMSSGAFCLTHRYEGLEQDFQEGYHLEAWSTYEELLDKIKYYLDNDRERNKIARRGCREVRTNHSWMARVKDIKNLLEDKLHWIEEENYVKELRILE